MGTLEYFSIAAYIKIIQIKLVVYVRYFTGYDWNCRSNNSQVYLNVSWIVLSSWYLVHQIHMQSNELTTHMKRNEKYVSAWSFFSACTL